jgi:hypothetical protein
MHGRANDVNSAGAENVRELLRKAEGLPHGALQFNMVEEASRLADATRDLDLMFAARMKLVQAGVFGGHGEKSLAAFAWCVAHFEQDAARFRSHQFDLLWSFKWVCEGAKDFPQMSRQQLDGIFEQMSTQYRRCGYGMRPVYYCRFAFAVDNGDRITATEWLRRFQAEPRDGMANCLACEADTITEYYDLIGESEMAVETAQPSLDGKRRCAEVPHRTLNNVLRPLALLGRYEEADGYQRRGYQMIRGNPDFLRHISMQMAYLVHRGRPAAAVNMLERHLGWALETHEIAKRYCFYVTALRVLKMLAEKRSTRKLALPSEFPLRNNSGEYELAALIGWFQSECDDLAARFDRRNGNDFFGREVAVRMSY